MSVSSEMHMQLMTEYESSYNRSLWDEETRVGYFQLAEERKLRLLKGGKHSPLHWDQKPETTSSNEQIPQLKEAWGEKPASRVVDQPKFQSVMPENHSVQRARPVSAPALVLRPKKPTPRTPKRNSPPFAMYGNAAQGVRKTYNVMPNSREIHPSALRAKFERARLRKHKECPEREANMPVNKKVIAFPMTSFVGKLNTQNRPRGSGSWSTEYTRNF